MLIGFLCAVTLSGCTSVIRPHVTEAEFLTAEPKIAGHAELYVSEAFRTHTETKTDPLDFKKWQFDLGPLAVDTFKYSLGSRFEKVHVKLGEPSFPLSATNTEDLVVAIEPEFAGFKSHCPILFKFETYVVQVSFKVKAFDQTGKILVDKVYHGVGKKRGAIGQASSGLDANPVAAQLALKDAINQAVTDILVAVKK
jgi:hypothetical protein